jgi:hypothetical protein
MGRSPGFVIFTTRFPPLLLTQPCRSRSFTADFWFTAQEMWPAGGVRPYSSLTSSVISPTADFASPNSIWVRSS